MSFFQYEILDSGGNLQNGEIEASSKSSALAALSRDGQQVVTIKESKPKRSRGGDGKRSGASGEAVILSQNQLIQFTEELSDMLDAGLPLEQSLGAISTSSEVPKIREVAGRVHAQYSEGSSLADSLDQASPSFSPLYCNLVLAGEQSASVGKILARQVAYLSSFNELRSKIKTALIYPAFLAFSALAVIALFLFVLIPRLEQLMDATGGELPFLARLFADAKTFLVEHWWQVLAGLVLVFVAALIFFQSSQGRAAKDRLILELPVLGPLYKSFFNLQFAQTVSNLMINGMHQSDALELSRGVTENPILKKQLEDVIEHSNRGARLDKVLARNPVFDRALIDMARVGEDTGNLAESLQKAAARLERNFNRGLEAFTALIQPVITILIAGIVGLMAYMMVSVVYDTISTIRDQQF